MKILSQYSNPRKWEFLLFTINRSNKRSWKGERWVLDNSREETFFLYNVMLTVPGVYNMKDTWRFQWV